MANDLKLQSSEGTHPVDENLRPILVGGKSTAIETAQQGDGARVSGDLSIVGGNAIGDTPTDPNHLASFLNTFLFLIILIVSLTSSHSSKSITGGC